MGENVFVISGFPGSGSSSVAKQLAEKLNLKYFSPGQLFKGISGGTYKSQYYSETFLQVCKEKNLSIPDMQTSEKNKTINLWETEFGKSPVFHHALDELQQRLADQGNIVLDGKLSIHMIKAPTLKVWLHASLKERARRTSMRENISEDEAEKILQKRQQYEKEEWKRIYSLDYFEQEKKADLVLDTEDKSAGEIVEILIEKFRTMPFVVGVTGPICSGTDTFSEFLEEHGYCSFSYSDELREEARKRGIEITRKNLQDLGDELRRVDGAGILSQKILKKMLPGKKYAVGNIRNPAEAEELKKNSFFKLIMLDALPEIRFQRLLKRNRESDPQTFEEFKIMDERDFGENEESYAQQHLKVFRMADLKIENNGSVEELKLKIQKIL